MSYTTSIIAARTTVEGLRDAVIRAWTKLRIAEQAANIRDFAEFHVWSAQRPNAKAFYQDGAWAILFDPLMTMCADDAELASLSRALGKIFIGTTQGTAGFAEIIVLDGGREIRRITYVDGELTQSGSPLAEEKGLDVDEEFYMGANEEIAERLGIASFQGEIEGPIHAAQFVRPSSP